VVSSRETELMSAHKVTLAWVVCKAIATNPRQGMNISAPSTLAYMEASNWIATNHTGLRII
jgi:hypothetical protein